jgi:hypothetical protein
MSENGGDVKKMKIPKNPPKLLIAQYYPTSKIWS